MSKTGISKVNEIFSVVFLLMLAGFTLRIYDLGLASFWLDESISSIAAMAILEKGMPVLPSGILYDRGILNTFLIAIAFKLFGISEFAARIPSVLFGTLTILLVYFFGLKLGNKRIGLIAAFLVTFSVWEIGWSREARMYQQLQFFYILSLYLFYEFVQNKDLKHLVLLTFSFLGTIMSDIFGYVLIVVFPIYLGIFALCDWKSMKKFNGRTIISIVLVFGILLVFAYYMGVVQYVFKTNINYFDFYVYLLKSELGIFLFLAIPGATMLVNRDWKKGIILIAGLIIPLYFVFFHVLLLGTRYLFFVIPILFLMIAYFLDSVISKEVVPNIILVSLLSITMFISPAFTFIPRETYDLGINVPQPDFKTAYNYVKGHMLASDVIVSAWTPPAQFYLGKSDYWLAFNVVGTGEKEFLIENSRVEIYTNATAISDIETLKTVVDEHSRGWVIVDGVATYKLMPGIMDYLNNNLTLYMETDRKDMKVYGWDK